jgi:hypothetical protein
MILESIEKRRSYYALTAKSTLSDAQIKALVETSVKHAPSSFNSQSTRAVVLLGKEHHALWNITREALRAIVPTDKFAPTEEKINSFAAGYGTILYFEDWTAVEALQAQFPAYKDNFPIWAYQANAMVEYIIWTALADAGMGASLQHYNPLIDDEVKKHFNLPSAWKLVAQMPFGVAAAPAGEKTFLPIDDRVIIKK